MDDLEDDGEEGDAETYKDSVECFVFAVDKAEKVISQRRDELARRAIEKPLREAMTHSITDLVDRICRARFALGSNPEEYEGLYYEALQLYEVGSEVGLDEYREKVADVTRQVNDKCGVSGPETAIQRLGLQQHQEQLLGVLALLRGVRAAGAPRDKVEGCLAALVDAAYAFNPPPR
mmetsp:Transcript_135061/g.305752  ORF Transcript_135061/g.305752 Transcript_135061/m.305752 type:complete len:177 (+) Transcript_135061:1-531(+)